MFTPFTKSELFSDSKQGGGEESNSFHTQMQTHTHAHRIGLLTQQKE